MQIRPSQRRNWGTYDVRSWANDSLFKARQFAYRDVNGHEIRDGDRIGRAYFRSSASIVRTQLQQGGIRLAFLINEAAAGRSAFPKERISRSGAPGRTSTSSEPRTRRDADAPIAQVLLDKEWPRADGRMDRKAKEGACHSIEGRFSV